jgi:hypothetical protein
MPDLSPLVQKILAHKTPPQNIVRKYKSAERSNNDSLDLVPNVTPYKLKDHKRRIFHPGQLGYNPQDKGKYGTKYGRINLEAELENCKIKSLGLALMVIVSRLDVMGTKGECEKLNYPRDVKALVHIKHELQGCADDIRNLANASILHALRDEATGNLQVLKAKYGYLMHMALENDNANSHMDVLVSINSHAKIIPLSPKAQHYMMELFESRMHLLTTNLRIISLMVGVSEDSILNAIIYRNKVHNMPQDFEHLLIINHLTDDFFPIEGILCQRFMETQKQQVRKNPRSYSVSTKIVKLDE